MTKTSTSKKLDIEVVGDKKVHGKCKTPLEWYDLYEGGGIDDCAPKPAPYCPKCRLYLHEEARL